MLKKNNQDLRDYAKEKEVPFWSICDHLKISESTMTRKMRRPLSDKETKDLKKVIDLLAKKRG